MNLISVETPQKPTTKRGWATVLGYCADTDRYEVVYYHETTGWKFTKLWRLTHWAELPVLAQGGE